jgi:hypothetical protein
MWQASLSLAQSRENLTKSVDICRKKNGTSYRSIRITEIFADASIGSGVLWWGGGHGRAWKREPDEPATAQRAPLSSPPKIPCTMTAADLIDGHVSSAQCSKAIDALLKHGLAHQEKLAENELLPGAEPHVWLVLAVKQMQPEKKLKPFKMCV